MFGVQLDEKTQLQPTFNGLRRPRFRKARSGRPAYPIDSTTRLNGGLRITVGTSLGCDSLRLESH